jgi:predicted nucleotidyltransferase
MYICDMNNLEQLKTKEIEQLCKSNKVKSLFAFGSITTDDFNKDSDIDLVVDFNEDDPFTYTDLYFNLKAKLEDLLKRKVDLLEERAINNRFFKQQLEITKIEIYGA